MCGIVQIDAHATDACRQCLLCPGCRESIEEDEDFTLIKKKAFHTDCARDTKHCRVCDKVRPLDL